MNEKTITLDVLQDVYPTECEIVGPTNMEDIIDPEINFASAEHGSYLDIGTAISTLAVAATFIKTVIDIVIAAKKELGRNPLKEDIEIRIVGKKEIIRKLDKETQEKLIKSIIKKLN